MAWSFSINSVFNPLTYDEITKPLQLATDLLNLYEDMYATTAALAAEVAAKLDRTRDPKARKLYEDYYNSLMQSADELLNRGLTPSSRRNLNAVRVGYTQHISPIIDAITRRSAHIDELRKKSLDDESLLTSGIGSVDDYLGNQDATYHSYSGRKLKEDVESVTKHFADLLRNYGMGKPVDLFTNTFVKEYGIEAKDIDAVIQTIRDPNSRVGNQIIRNIINNVVSSSGIANWADDRTLSQAYDWAGRGAYAALGKTDVSTFTNQGALLDAQMLKELQKAALTAKLAATKGKEEGTPSVDRTTYAFTKDREEISKFFDKSGNLTKSITGTLFTNNGKFSKPKFKAPSVKHDMNVGFYTAWDETIKNYDSINKTLKNMGFTQELINNLTKNEVLELLKNPSASADLTGTNLYRWSLDEGTTKHIINKLKDRGLLVLEVTGVDEKGLTKGIREELSVDDDLTSDILFDSLRGELLILTGGKYYSLPNGMLSNDTYKNITDIISSRNQYEAAVKSLRQKKKTLGLTDRESLILLRTEQLVLEADYLLGAFGKEIVEYIGKKNIY